MADFVKDLKSDTWENTKSYLLIPLFILGGFFIILSFIPYFQENDYLSKGFYSIGTTMITAIVFLAVVKSKQFSKIFSKQLRDIIYCTEYLENRKDIRSLWLNSSKAMYEKNFPELSEKIEDNLEKYIPIDSSTYYENYVYKIDISFDSKDQNFITLDERETFDLVSRTREPIEYKFRSIFNKESYKDEISDYKLNSLKINRNVIECKAPQFQIDKSFQGNKIKVQYNANLKGSNKYSIEKQEYRKYSLKVENTKSHTCRHIFNNYTLEVTYPKELEVKFYENGTLNNFEKIPVRTVGDSFIQRHEYKGIMFKNQGTRMIFRDLRLQ